MEALKKVLIITYYWPPSGGAGVQRTLKFVKYLPEFGIEPVLLTVDPSVASYPVKDESLTAEVPSRLEIIRTRSFEPLNFLARIAGKDKVPHGGFSNTAKGSFSQKALRWIRGNFFIPDARVGWVMHAVKAAISIIEKDSSIDTVYISSPPHSSQLIGFQLRVRFPKIRWIADLRDPWTKIYYYPELLHTGMAKKADKALERKVLSTCDHAVVVSKYIRNEFAELGEVSTGKIAVIPNGYDENDFAPASDQISDRFTITYTGTLAESYNPESLFSSLSNLVKITGLNKLRLRFVGTMPPSVRGMLGKYGLESCCEFIAYVPHAEAIRYMQESHINLLMIPDSPGAEGILTGKLFEYLGAARPILGVGPADGDAAAIVKECAAGEFFSRSQSEHITNWLLIYFRQWKEGAEIVNTSTIHHKYRRRALTGQLAAILLNKS